MKQGVFRGAIRDGVSSDKTDLISCIIMRRSLEISSMHFSLHYVSIMMTAIFSKQLVINRSKSIYSC